MKEINEQKIFSVYECNFFTWLISLVPKHSSIQYGQKSRSQLNKKGSSVFLRRARILTKN